jgi:hypothetical protein
MNVFTMYVLCHRTRTPLHGKTKDYKNNNISEEGFRLIYRDMVRVMVLDTPVSFTNKTDHHDITEILLKVVLNTINQPPSKVFSEIICLTELLHSNNL